MGWGLTRALNPAQVEKSPSVTNPCFTHFRCKLVSRGTEGSCCYLRTEQRDPRAARGWHWHDTGQSSWVRRFTQSTQKPL